VGNNEATEACRVVNRLIKFIQTQVYVKLHLSNLYASGQICQVHQDRLEAASVEVVAAEFTGITETRRAEMGRFSLP
jgi:uncharacterized protein (UPF0179 family)